MSNAKHTEHKFQVGETYITKHLYDRERHVSITVAKRTAKTITTTDGTALRIRREPVGGGIEWVLPCGDYPFAPWISAD